MKHILNIPINSVLLKTSIIVAVTLFYYSSNIAAQNTLLGSQAGQGATNGSNNIYIGTNAGLNWSGDNNVFIGKKIGTGTSGSNMFTLGNGNTNLLSGDFSSTQLTLNGYLTVVYSGLSMNLKSNDIAFSRPSYNYVSSYGSGGSLAFKTTTTGSVQNINMLINPDGWIGIGTLTPGSKLELKDGDFLLNGGTVKLIKPVTTGDWVRGLEYNSGTALWGGIGMYGTNTTQTNLYMATGSTPWANGKGLYVLPSGNVLVGKTTQTNATYALDVKGKIAADSASINGVLRTKEVIIQNPLTADFVFADDYKLNSLDSVKTFIEKNNHLPGVPSAAAMQQNGIGVSEMNQLLLQKVEELTLYLLEQKKEIEMLKQKVNNN